MTEIILYDFWRSSASYRVRIALNLKGVAYHSVPTNLTQGEHHSAEYRARNPQGFVPMLSVDGHDLTQSLAIIDYLDARYSEPPLLPDDPAERAKTMGQALLIAADIHPINNLRILNYLRDVMGQDQAAVDGWYRHWISEGFSALEKSAPENGFFGGEKPNLADIFLVPQMYNARRLDTPLDDFPKLVRIDGALTALPEFNAALPENVKPV